MTTSISSDFNSHFLAFIKKHNLFEPNHNILAAVSGGMDSVVMCDLFYKNNIPFDIAHINFKLRTLDSDHDEIFVKKLAEKYKVRFHFISFETTEYAKINKLSIEMAARELRYKWLNQLREEHNYSSIAVAHHQNDQVETILLNLTKGTGLRGLHGILPKKNYIIRPLMFATKEAIQQYSKESKLSWCEDKTNKDIKFQRNLIRHKVLPHLKKINPNLERNINEFVTIISDVEKQFDTYVENLKNKIITKDNGNCYIDIEELRKIDRKELVLYEILKEYGFNYPSVEKILESIDSQSGKKYTTQKYQLVKDRKSLIISEIRNNHQETLIDENTECISFEHTHFDFEVTENETFSDLKSPHLAYLDFDTLTFPLKLRHWERGDYFYPFGMKTKKKLSDFFIDIKLPIPEKEKTLIITSSGRIIWIAGCRIDNRFRVTKTTRKVFRIEMT